MFGMANLQPEETGLGLIVHVYKDESKYSKHGPRLKVFPGRPSRGDATTITVPTTGTDSPKVIGKVTIKSQELRAAKAFAMRNFAIISLYWYSVDFTGDDLRAGLRLEVSCPACGEPLLHAETKVMVAT